MTARPSGLIGIALKTGAAAGVALGLWGLAAFSALDLMMAWLTLAVTVPLIAGMRAAPAVVMPAGAGFFGLGVLNWMTPFSTLGWAASLLLFWTAGICFATAKRARVRQQKMVRS